MFDISSLIQLGLIYLFRFLKQSRMNSESEKNISESNTKLNEVEEENKTKEEIVVENSIIYLIKMF